MTLKFRVKSALITFVSILICSLIVTMVVNKLVSPQHSLFYNYLDFLFYIDMIVLLIACGMLISQSGAYNSISYTINLFKSRVSTSYKHTLMTSADIEDKEISGYLKQTYLYRNTHYKHTYTLLLPSLLILLSLILYTSIAY